MSSKLSFACWKSDLFHRIYHFTWLDCDTIIGSVLVLLPVKILHFSKKKNALKCQHCEEPAFPNAPSCEINQSATQLYCIGGHVQKITVMQPTLEAIVVQCGTIYDHKRKHEKNSCQIGNCSDLAMDTPLPDFLESAIKLFTLQQRNSFQLHP